MEIQTNILLCQDSVEGITTGIYEAYEQKLDLQNVRLELKEACSISLFATYIDVKPSTEKSEKVLRTIRRIYGEEDYEAFFFLLYSCDIDKAQAAFCTIREALRFHSKRLFRELTDSYVQLGLKLSKNTWREAHHYMGFTRFSQIEDSFLYAKVSPKSHILLFIMEHFSDRLPMENFLIHDEKRHLLGVHMRGQQWFIQSEDSFPKEILQLKTMAEEDFYEELFCAFCKSIAIDKRRNLSLQRQLLPLRFRENMTEFK